MTSEERRKEALESLSGCTIHNPRRHNAPQFCKKHEPPKRKRSNDAHVSGRAWSQCAKKRAYEGSREAQRVADRIFAERGVKLRVYPCWRCGKYHLTKSILENEMR